MQDTSSINPERKPEHSPNLDPEEQFEVRSLRELIDRVSGRTLKPSSYFETESSLSDVTPFPFLALVGQTEMKLALLLALINPMVGGVLLIGPRGTGKTTAVRSLINILPKITRSVCFYGCTEEDVKAGGQDAVCPECAKKFAQGDPLATEDYVRLIELPLNAQLEDVIGGLDERTIIHERFRLKRGILARSDKNILYLDEANLLANDIVDAILDAAAQGTFTVRRGALSATYNSRFTLIGTMNPEEGSLRPQIMDRFGLRVIARGLQDSYERQDAYERVREYIHHPLQLIKQYAPETDMAREEIQSARELLEKVLLPKEVARAGIHLIQSFQIDSLRAEITLFEAARAYAAADSRIEVSLNDLRIVAPMALRLRRSPFMIEFFKQQIQEENELKNILDSVLPETNNKLKPG
jgi:magnesium chelatase subunit I